MTSDDQFLTEEGYKKAEQELEKLLKKRKVISERIHTAKEMGDISENAEYAQAKDEQAFLEGRVTELKTLLENATVVNHEKGASSIIEIGSRISVDSDRGKQEYTIVGSNEADPLKGMISQASPLGQAFLGRNVNDIVEVETPRGKMQYTILAVE